MKDAVNEIVLKNQKFFLQSVPESFSKEGFALRVVLLK